MPERHQVIEVALWGLALAAFILARSVHSAGISEVVGSKVGSFDFVTTTKDTSARTFTENVGWALGMTLMPDGRVAILLAGSTQSDNRPVVVLGRIDVTTTTVWRKTDGPFKLNGPAGVGLSYGLTMYGSNFAVGGKWVSDVTSSGQTNNFGAFSFVLGSMNATKIATFKQNVSYSGLAWMPAEGNEPEGWALDTHADRTFEIYNAGGGLRRTITFADLGLAAGSVREAGGICRTSTGDLITMGDYVKSPVPGPNWDCVDCVRFDRKGTFKGLFNVGITIRPDKPPTGWNALCQLSNGDILAGGLLKSNVAGNDGSYSDTYRYYIFRPPVNFSQPRINADSMLTFPTVRVNEQSSATLSISNWGSASLHISDIVLNGTEKDFFKLNVTTPVSIDVPPSYGVYPAPADKTVLIPITFKSSKIGSKTANVIITSNDPLANIKSVPMSAFAAPKTYANTILTSAGLLRSDATGFGGLYMNKAATKLLVVVHGSGTYPSRIMAVPVVRDSLGRISGFGTASAETIADVAYSGGGLIEGPDGMLWYAKDPSNSVTIVQRKPDGTTFEQEMPSLKNDGPQDFDLGPDNMLVVARNDGFRVYRWTLTQNTAGFWVLGTSTQIGYLGATHGKVVPRVTGEHDYLLERGGVFVLHHGDAALWGGGTALESSNFAVSLKVNGFCRDPLTNDILYADTTKGLHRLDGFPELIATTPQRSFVTSNLLGQTTLTTSQKSAADYNGDGKVDIADLVKMISTSK